MRNLLIAVTVIALVGLGTFLLVNANNNSTPATNNMTNDTTDNTSTTPNDTSNNGDNQTETCTKKSDEVHIVYSGNGFSPVSAEIKVCQTLVWVNQSSSQVQIGVDPHPSHTSDNLITNGEFTLNLDPNETKSIVMTKVGTFGYHNHLDSLQTGTIVVSE